MDSSARRGGRGSSLRVTVVSAVLVLAGGACTSGASSGHHSGSTPGATATLPVGGQTITASVPTGTTGRTLTLAVADPATLPAPPPGMVFPLGAVHLEVQHVAPAGVVQVTVGLSTKVDSVRKLINGNWDPFHFDGTTGASVSADGLTITLDLQDGGRGDADGLENGTIVDPWAAVTATSLLITTVDVPTVYIGLAYSTQLQAAGAQGTVHWTNPSGGLPNGVTLSDSGLLSGTATGPAFLAQVQATDDVASSTKLLLFGTFAATTQPTATGQMLPDGSRVFFGAMDTSSCIDNGCFSWAGRYLADGTESAIDTTSVSTYLAVVGGAGAVNSAATMAVAFTFPSTPGPSTGPVEVVDARTGTPIHEVESSPIFQIGSVSFSPNGAYLALTELSGSTRIFDTSDWHVTRTLAFANGRAIWSPDSTRMVGNVGGTVSVLSASDATGASDHTISISGQTTCDPLDWSATTDRLVLACESFNLGTIVTASAVDGSDARAVVTDSCDATTCVRYTWSGGS